MEIETVGRLVESLDAGRGLRGMRLQGLDLTSVEDRLLRLDPRGAVVLGGVVSDRLEAHLRSGGAVVFPAVSGVPIDPYRSRLYDVHDLYAGLEAGYDATPDARTYRWYLNRTIRDDVFATMLRAVHDDSIADALREALRGRRTVGVMGGHALLRGDPTYARAVDLGRRLAGDGAMLLTGGGPGAMEAASLGAALHDRPDADMTAALDALAAVPSFRPDVTAWARAALDVRHRLALDGEPIASIGVPTWFYGHEPSNVFAGAVAKYFSNAEREDVLLSGSSVGIVVLAGAAGTVQEVFQAATRAYYAAGPDVARIVLVGSRHWTTTLPVWPLLRALGDGREMARRVHLVDTVDEAADLLLN